MDPDQTCSFSARVFCIDRLVCWNEWPWRGCVPNDGTKYGLEVSVTTGTTFPFWNRRLRRVSAGASREDPWRSSVGIGIIRIVDHEELRSWNWLSAMLLTSTCATGRETQTAC